MRAIASTRQLSSHTPSRSRHTPRGPREGRSSWEDGRGSRCTPGQMHPGVDELVFVVDGRKSTQRTSTRACVSAQVRAKRHPSTLRERRAMADPRQRKGTSLGCKEGRRKLMWFPRCNKVPSCSKVDPSMTTQARVRRSLPHRSRLASCHSIPIRTPFLPASSGNR